MFNKDKAEIEFGKREQNPNPEDYMMISDQEIAQRIIYENRRNILTDLYNQRLMVAFNEKANIREKLDIKSEKGKKLYDQLQNAKKTVAKLESMLAVLDEYQKDPNKLMEKRHIET